ncbi:hypothetical protein L7F22_017995 [Adiantum nelumboides]|nr:hypothetical protein [Adiantum nelumboides]
MAFIPQLTVLPGAFEDVCPPGVELETKAFAHQAACIPWPSMLTSPPSVPVESSGSVSLCVPNSFAHFHFVRPLPLQCGNTASTVPHEDMSSRLSTWQHGTFPYSPLPPHVPRPLPPPPPPPQRSHMPSGLPTTVPRFGSLEDTINIDMTRKLSMPDEQKLSVFVGKIPPSLDNDLVTSFLKLCGSIKSWTRAKDPVTGTEKGFGFCEYESPESLLRALRLLNRLKLEGQQLVLKVEKSTLDYLERHVDQKIQSLKFRGDVVAESIQGTEAVHARTHQTLDVPREVPVEERLGWVFDEEKKIDKVVSENLMNLLKQRCPNKALDIPSGMADSGINRNSDSGRGSIAEEDQQRVQLVEWKKIEDDLKQFRLRGQLSDGLWCSDSFYAEYEKLWEERERAREAQRKSESERDQAVKKMRKILIKAQEEGRTDWEGLSPDERHGRKVVEKMQDKACSLQHQNYVATGLRFWDSYHSSKGEALSQSKFLGLSTRAKVAFSFKSSPTLKQSEPSAAGRNSLWEESEDNGEGYNGSKQMVSQFDNTSTIGKDSFWLQEKPTGDDHKQQKHAVISRSYRNPTLTWERESTPEEQPASSQKDVAKEPVNRFPETKPIIPERCKPVNTKELIDKIPRTKDEVFSFCMNWETFDKGSKQVKNQKFQRAVIALFGLESEGFCQWNQVPVLGTVWGEKGYESLSLDTGEKGYESFFGYRMDGNKEEGSSSEDRQSNPTVHEVGEGSSQAEEGFPHAACKLLQM